MKPVVFNKAIAMNAGYMESLEDKFDCYIFHDVDALPQDDRHMYMCREQPIHLGAYDSRNKYRYNSIMCLSSRHTLVGYLVAKHLIFI